MLHRLIGSDGKQRDGTGPGETNQSLIRRGKRPPEGIQYAQHHYEDRRLNGGGGGIEEVVQGKGEIIYCTGSYTGFAEHSEAKSEH